MNRNEVFSVSRVHAVVACACLLAYGQFAQAADVRLGNMNANRILYLGNSITYHPSLPSINWYGTWGMAASSADKDYVHVLTNKIAQAAGAMPSIMATNIFTFERNYNTYDVTTNLQAELAFHPDIVVLAIGENVLSLDTVEAQTSYATAYSNLLNILKSNGNPTIFTRSCFWADPTKDQIMKTATLAAGDYFVDISSLCKDGANYAYSEPTYADAKYSTFNSHPGDTGMAAIANLLYGSMVAHSVPEPGTLILLGAGLIGLICYAKVKRR